MSFSINVLLSAYVRMQSVQNLGLAVVNIVNGIIVDKKGYFILELTMLAWLCGQCCIFPTIFLNDFIQAVLSYRSAHKYTTTTTTTTTTTVLWPFVRDYLGELVPEGTPTHHPDHYPVFIIYHDP